MTTTLALTAREVISIALASIDPDPQQPRNSADDDLGPSIVEQGVLQPITVRAHPNAGDFALKGNGDVHQYMIVDGERRYRGAARAKLTEIPAIIIDDVSDEAQRLVRQSTFNTGKPLTPMEEAKAWKRIQELTGKNIAELCRMLGRPKSTVSDRLAIAEAPEAFHELFAKGTLSAAAAPIVRHYADVPNKTLERAVELIRQSWAFHDAEEQGRAVPLNQATNIIANTILHTTMREIPKELANEFRGLVVTIKSVNYTPDIERLETLAKDVAARDRGKTAPKIKQPNPASAAERKRVQEAKKKSALRRQQFNAIVGKLPDTLGDLKWLRFVAKTVTHEMHNDSLRVACKVFGLDVSKNKHGYGNDFGGAVRKHVDELNASDVAKVIVELLLCPDLSVSPWSSMGAQRIHAAAELANVDLKKVKLPDPAPNAAKVRAAKGKRPAAMRFMSPMQPDAVLGAIIGDVAMSRTEVTTKLWRYIKKHELQDKRERRMINADAKMKALFGGKKRASMFELTKLVTKHLRPAK